MQDTDRLIWTSNPDYEEWKQDLLSHMPGESRERRMDIMQKANRDLLEKDALSHTYREKILVIADLGLWNGRFPGYSELESGNIRDCFVPNRDSLSVCWFVDRDGDLRCEDIHHDGTNRYLYRVWKENLNPEDKELLKEKIYFGDCTRRDIQKYTRRLGDEIGRVYGWVFPKERMAKGGEAR